MADLEIFEIGLRRGRMAHRPFVAGTRLRDRRGVRRMGGKASGARIQYLCMTEEDIIRLEGFGK